MATALRHCLTLIFVFAFPASAVASDLKASHVVELLQRQRVAAPSVKVGWGRTHFVYLHPTDRPLRSDYLQAVQYSQDTLRDWYTAQLGGRYAPSMTPAIAVALSHVAAHYSEPDGSGDPYLTFWNKVLAEAFQKTGAAFLDPANAWVFFVDAPAGCEQLSGGGTSGIAIMSQNDLRGLVGEGALGCDGQPSPPHDSYPVARWVGGQGHEMGHAYGLPHPPGCDEGLASCDYQALMYAGFYYGFPDATYLREDDRTYLIGGSYVADLATLQIFASGFEL